MLIWCPQGFPVTGTSWMAGVTQRRRRRRRRRRRDSHPPPPLLLLPPPSPLPSPTPPPPPAAVERRSSLDIEAASDHDKIAVVAPSSSAAMGWNLAEASVDASPPPATVDAWRDGSVLTLNAEPKSYYRRPYSSVYDSLETLMQVCRETLRLVKLGKAMPVKEALNSESDSHDCQAQPVRQTAGNGVSATTNPSLV